MPDPHEFRNAVTRPVPMDPQPTTDTQPVTLRCWGTRGSIPSPGPATARYGGNTTCVEVKVGDHRLVFDAGSGIRLLGHDMVRKGTALDTPVFLTHFHWDHIQGFPFFAPLYDPDTALRILGPKQEDIDVRSVFAGQMGPIHFPVPFSAVAATLSFDHLNEGSWEGHGITLHAMRLKHPSYVLGYRIQAAGRVICFLPDNELDGQGYDVPADWRRRLVDFVGGADLLIHDAMYTDEEYRTRPGWGHSTFHQAARLADEAGVGRLLFFHHDPERSDDALDDITARLRDEGGARGSAVDIDAAREGMDYRVGVA